MEVKITGKHQPQGPRFNSTSSNIKSIISDNEKYIKQHQKCSIAEKLQFFQQHCYFAYISTFLVGDSKNNQHGKMGKKKFGK